MTKNEAIEIIERIAALDYNGEASCTATDARRAMELASRPGHCSIDEAPEAIKLLGIDHAALAYVCAWDNAHEAEYGSDDDE